ncbi:hypothetical protein SAMN05216278_0615 [Halopelagius longus]|uniref:Uncharacterized protein n=2 Tax=Halopelagius longus TaxID=1236180 RepID=A0A1H0YGQ8_9EURY|nr:hypothetical protein SAMN05216278_0615 [Halopelagius longus]
MSGGNPGVIINSSISNPDAPEIYPGDEVTVRLTYGDRTAEFPAKGTKSTVSNPAAFKAVRGKQPVGSFEEYEKVKQMLKQAESDSK